MLLSGFASFWTERLWFRSVGYGEVFTTLLLTRIGLFFVFAGLMAATVGVAMAMAYRFRPVLWPGMPGMPDDGMDRYRELLAPRMNWVIAGAAIVMGLFAGASATGQWRSYSMWRHAQDFGTTDPYFNKDVGLLRLPAAVLALPRRLRDGAGRRRPDRRGASSTTSSAASACPRGRATGSPAPRRSRCRHCWRCSCWPRPSTTGSTASTWSPTPARSSRAWATPTTRPCCPAKEILAGIAVVCARAVPGQHLASHLAAAVGRRGAVRPVGDHPRPHRAVGRAGDPGEPQRARPRGSLHPGQHRRDPHGLRPRPDRRRPGRGHARSPAAASSTSSTG